MKESPRKVAFLGILIASTAVWAAGPAENARSIDEKLKAEVEKGFRGQVLLERDGVVHLDAAYGMRDEASTQAASTEDLFYIGSLAKMFTSAAVLQLEGEGKLSLNDKISKHLPAVPADKSAITIRQLLMHASGAVANYSDPLARIGRDEFLKWFLSTPLDFKPGERNAYSNVGYSALAVIVERVAEKPFDAVIRERIFSRAEMNDTFFLDDPALDARRLARGSGPRLEEFKQDGDPLKYGGTWLRMGPGGIVSNARDLLKWERAIRTEKVLTAAQYAKATTPAKPGTPWGLGWRLSRTTRKTPLHFHDGGFPGFNAGFARFPAENAIIIILCNRDEAAQSVVHWITSDFFKE